ncbi:hypothetical protein ACM16X_02325 [Haloarcula japonica]|uniref:hypothetical protein n=1 Tax=Haloarcula japonica TaxID=29282 RepID=UPI0039F6961A
MMNIRPEIRSFIQGSDDGSGGGEESGALDSGYSHEEIRENVESREEFLSHLDQQIQVAERKARMHFREALNSEGAEKRRHYRKANGYKKYREGFQKLSDQVANSQQSLAVMDVEAIQEKIADQVEDLGFSIDVTEMPVDDVSAAIEQNGFDVEEQERVRKQLERSQQVSGGVDAPYQGLMDEGEAVEAEEIQGEVDQLSETRRDQDEELDREIREELEDL